jgi:hypothetical protein
MRWTSEVVGRLLTNEAHLGKIIYNKTKGDGHKNKPNRQKPQKIPRDQWIVVENRHKPVKTQNEHDRILIRMQQNNKGPFRRTKNIFPFKGLIRCGLCGYGLMMEEKPKYIRVKSCWHRDSVGVKCTNLGGDMQYVVDAVEEQLKEYEEQIIAEINGCETQSTDVIQSQIKMIMDKINLKEKALKRARVAYDEGVDTLDEYRTAKERISKEMDELENLLNIENLKLQQLSSMSNHEKLHYIKEFRDKMSNKELSSQELNDLYKTIISSIVWTHHGDKIDIKVNFL